MMHKVLQIDNDRVLEVFLNVLLPIAVGKLKWNALTKRNLLSDFVHKSDKAFAMVVVENCAPRWLDVLKNPTKEVKDREKTLYTLGNEERGTAGWSADGIERFVYFCKIVSDKYADESGTDYKRKCDEVVKRKYYSKKRLRTREKDARKRFGMLYGLRNEEEEEEKVNKELNHDLLAVMNDDYSNIISV